MSTFTTTEHYVYHMEVDEYIEGNILFSDGSALKTTDGTETKTIAGQAIQGGYREGLGTTARFKDVSGFHQISSSKVILADNANRCIRLVDRRTRHTQTFFGSCAKAGYPDVGPLALLNQPFGIIPDNQDQHMLLVTDIYNKAILHLNILSRDVSTFFKDKTFTNYLAGITQEVSSGNLFISTHSSTAVYLLHYRTKELKLVAGSAGSAGYRDDDTFSIEMYWAPNALLLIDNRRKLLRFGPFSRRLGVLDIGSNRTKYICTGTNGHTDGDHDSCALLWPRSLMVSGGSLYIGEYQNIRRWSGKTTVSKQYCLWNIV